MSVVASAWAWSVRAVGASADRDLLVFLAGRADEDGRGRVSWSDAADAVAPRGSMVRGYMGRLERRGFVIVHEEAGGDGLRFALPLADLAEVRS